MLRGSYSVYLLADVADLGWKGTGNSRKRYIALLWYKNGGKPFAQSMPIIVPSERKDRPGHVRDTNCQFQMIFRLLNGDQLIVPENGRQLDYEKIISTLQGACKTSNLNFCVTFKIMTDDKGIKRQFVYEIGVSDSVVVVKNPSIKWPPNWTNKFHKYATPGGKPMSLGLSKLSTAAPQKQHTVSKPVKIECNMDIDLCGEDPVLSIEDVMEDA